jgi:two-component system response regulator HydG
MTAPNTLLFVDDDIAVCDAMQLALGNRGFNVECRQSGADALLALEQTEFDVVITDLQMPGMAGFEFCRHAQKNQPNLPVIVITAFGSLETAVAAIRAGAYDFISKPIQLDELALTLARALEHHKIKRENAQLHEIVAQKTAPADMIGDSPGMTALYALLTRVAGSEATVLITGESGTGKELVARAVHARSPRRSGPLVAINCAAMTDTLLESELFGHVRGAFTDAKGVRKGLLLQANGGTLFLDEIGDMTQATQVKLLRALQERKLRPVGSDHEVPFDVRIVCATSRDLESDVAEQRFREDLYYRINVIRIEVPPLRARGADILRLSEYYVAQYAARAKKPVRSIEGAAAAKLLAYNWPGNVRELQNCMERAVALTSSQQIGVDDLPDTISNYRVGHFVVATDNPAELLTLEQVEKRYILKVLQAVAGRRSQAADILGVDRRTLLRKLTSYDAP